MRVASGVLVGRLTVPVLKELRMLPLRLGRMRPTPSMVVAVVALFVALGGPAQAAHLIDGRLIRKSTITGRQIKDGAGHA